MPSLLPMPEYICEYHFRIEDDRGRWYRARCYGVSKGSDVWEGWLIFFPEGGGPLRRTNEETEQTSLENLASWAAAITPAYLDGALERSHPFREAGASPEEHGIHAAHHWEHVHP